MDELRLETVRALTAALLDVQYRVRRDALGGLNALESADSAGFRRLLAADAELAENLAYALFLGDDQEVRLFAASSLGHFDRVTPAARESLISALADGDARLRSAAAGSLGRLRGVGPAAVTSLACILGDQDASARRNAIAALETLAATEPAAVLALGQAMIGDCPVAEEAAATLLRLGVEVDLELSMYGELCSFLFPWGVNCIWVNVKVLTTNSGRGEAERRELGSMFAGPGRAGRWRIFTFPTDYNTRPVAEALPWVLLSVAGRVRNASETSNPVKAVSRMGRIHRLASSTVRVAIEAVDALARSEVRPRIVQILTKAIGFRVLRDMRRFAAVCLARMGESPPGLLGGLSEALEDLRPDICGEAAISLEEVGQVGPEVIRVLSEATKHAATCHRAVNALARQATSNGEAVLGLARAAHRRSSYVRRVAAVALGNVDRPPVMASRALAWLVKDRVHDVRSNAVASLTKLARTNTGALTALVEAVKHRDPDALASTIDALDRLGDASPGRFKRFGQTHPHTVALVEELLQDGRFGSTGVKAQTIRVLARLGLGSTKTVVALLPALRSADPQVRIQAIFALGQLGKGDPAVVEAVLGTLEAADADVRDCAVRMLEQIASQKRQALEPRQLPSPIAEKFQDLNREIRKLTEPWLRGDAPPPSGLIAEPRPRRSRLRDDRA